MIEILERVFIENPIFIMNGKIRGLVSLAKLYSG